MDWESASVHEPADRSPLDIDRYRRCSATDYVSLITRRLLRIALSKKAALAVNDGSIALCYIQLCSSFFRFSENPIGIVKIF